MRSPCTVYALLQCGMILWLASRKTGHMRYPLALQLSGFFLPHGLTAFSTAVSCNYVLLCACAGSPVGLQQLSSTIWCFAPAPIAVHA